MPMSKFGSSGGVSAGLSGHGMSAPSYGSTAGYGSSTHGISAGPSTHGMSAGLSGHGMSAPSYGSTAGYGPSTHGMSAAARDIGRGMSGSIMPNVGSSYGMSGAGYGASDYGMSAAARDIGRGMSGSIGTSGATESLPFGSTATQGKGRH